VHIMHGNTSHCQEQQAVPDMACVYVSTQSATNTSTTLCRMSSVNLGKGMTKPDGFRDSGAEIYRFSVNVTTGETTETCLVDCLHADFPVVPAPCVGRKTRYCYCSVAGDVLTRHDQVMCAFHAAAMYLLLPPSSPSVLFSRSFRFARFCAEDAKSEEKLCA
jgi:carotenoid cleavage dioxygenase-like enzyme